MYINPLFYKKPPIELLDHVNKKLKKSHFFLLMTEQVQRQCTLINIYSGVYQHKYNFYGKELCIVFFNELLTFPKHYKTISYKLILLVTVFVFHIAIKKEVSQLWLVQLQKSYNTIQLASSPDMLPLDMLFKPCRYTIMNCFKKIVDPWWKYFIH